MRLLRLLTLLAICAPGQVRAQDAAAGTSARAASQAYYHFLLGRHLEGEGKIEEAIESHRQAARLDPTAAEVPAELASLYARQGRFRDAVGAAEEALSVDPDNVEAHRVLGSIYASLAETREEEGLSREQAARRAVEHLEQGRRADGTDQDPGVDLALGRLYLMLDDPKHAVATLGRLIAYQPEAGEAHVLLARAETELGRPDRAAQVLERGAALNPRLLSPLAELLEQQHNWTDAARAYERLAAINPDSTDVKLRWATALLQAGDQDAARRARDLLVNVTGVTPGDPRAHYLRSNAERRLRDYDAAEASARKVIELDPGGWTGAFALAQVFEERHEYKRVIDTLAPVVARLDEEADRSTRDSATLLAHLGYAQLQVGRGEAAVRTFEQARQLEGSPATFEVSLIQAHLIARHYERAATLARAARRREGADDLRLFQLEARALISAGRHDRAVVVMRDAVSAHPGELQAYLSLADALGEADRHSEADRVLDRAAARFPDALLVSYQRGALLERREKYRDAEAAFRRVLARDPLHAPTLNYLGYMLAERGERLDEAVSLVERALAIDPDNPSYLDSLGWALFQRRQYDRAEPILRRAAERLPANSVVQDHLGDLLWALGRDDEARRAWERAIAGDREAVDVDDLERKVNRRR